MTGFSSAPGTVRKDIGGNYSADDFGRDIHHTKVHTPVSFNLIARVQGFKQLSHNWDGHNASAPSADVIDLAFDAITKFDHKGCLPTKVMPGVANDIAMLWQRPGFSVFLEISVEDGWEWSIEYNDGRPTQFSEMTGTVEYCAECLRKAMRQAED